MQCVSRLLSAFTLSLTLPLSFASAQVDLHAHLHMKPGVGILLQGAFTDTPKATNWSDRLYSKATSTSLAAMTSDTRPKLITISLYAHPYLSYSFSRNGFHFNRKENVRRAIEQEYQEFKQFVDAHADHFAIAKNAREARNILKAGKTVIVLSLEGAWGTLQSDADFELWVKERGLAIVTPVHLTPDSLGGNALMTAFISFTNSTADFFAALWASGGSCLKTYCKSEEGFTTEGNQLITKLMDQKVWIDVAHANEKEVLEVITRYETGSAGKPLPLLSTHTQFREFYPVERGLGKLEIDYIRKYDGIIGLLPSEYMIPEAMKQAAEESLKNNPNERDATSANGLSCISGLDVFKKTLAYGIATLGSPARVAMASDVNAPLNGLSSGCGEPIITLTNSKALDDALFDLHRKGYYTYSQWNALTKFAAPDPSWPDQTLEHFLLMWEKVRPSEVKTTSSKHPL